MKVIELVSAYRDYAVFEHGEGHFAVDVKNTAPFWNLKREKVLAHGHRHGEGHPDPRFADAALAHTADLYCWSAGRDR